MAAPVGDGSTEMAGPVGDGSTMAGNGAGEQRKDTGLGILVKSILGFFFVIIVVWWLHYTMVLKMLARRGASMLASYLAVNSTFDFALSMCGFIILGVTPMLSKTSGEGDDAASGKVMRQTIVISTVAGTITAVFLSVFHRELLLLFKPRDEDESLVAGASTMLLVQGGGFTFPGVCMGFFFIDLAMIEIYTILFVGSVRCV